MFPEFVITEERVPNIPTPLSVVFVKVPLLITVPKSVTIAIVSSTVVPFAEFSLIIMLPSFLTVISPAVPPSLINFGLICAITY